MLSRRSDPSARACCCAIAAAFGAGCIASGGAAFAHEAREPTPLPPIQVTADSPQKKRAGRKTGKPVTAAGRPIVYIGTPMSDSASSGTATGPANPPAAASQFTVSGKELNQRPFARPGAVLEAVPGLIVTQHSGEGKANQYFLRGFNLDHGTDLAISVDDVPVNMRTHAHGQGYADLNWLMPETIRALDIRKGPYFADDGDFASAGSLRIGLVDSVDKAVAQVTAGSFGYRRAFGIGSAKVGAGALLVAGEVGTYNGPWDSPDNVRKLNGLIRYTQGTALEGLSVTGMAYSNGWNATDQIPQRAIASGQIGRFGTEDPTDGGNTSRFALSARLATTDDTGTWKANAFVVRSELDLFNNFTYFLNDPTLGDQFHQRDSRILAGGNASRTFNASFAGLPMQTTFGIQSRYDAIDLGLTNTWKRSFLSNVRTDRVGEGSIGIYVQNHVHWTDWLRTTAGWRGNYFDAQVNALSNPNNSGHASAAMGSPKFGVAVGPFARTELFLNAGLGMHSNDARGATITEQPTDPSEKLSRVPLLVRTKGAEIGLRSKFIPGLESSLAAFLLDQDSELVFNGDSGDTSAKRPSRRYGFEWTNKYRPNSWLAVDADLAVTHARFIGYDSDQAVVFASLAGYPQAQIGNAPGNYIPNAPAVVASAGITLGESTGPYGSLRWRYLGSSPLTEDNAFRSSAISILNARVGYRADNGWRVQFDVFNLLNAQVNQITYAYGSLLKTDSLYNLCHPVQVAPAAVCQNGVMDYVLHPIEPRALRITLAGSF